MSLKTHYTCAEYAAMALPGYPTTERAWRDLVERESWAFTETKSRGRGGMRREYAPSKAVREALQARTMQVLLTSSGAGSSLPAPVLPGGTVPAAAAGFSSSLPVALDPATLTDKQRQGEHARGRVLAALDRLMGSAQCSKEAAMVTLLTNARSGQIEAPLLAMLKSARDARGRKGDELPSVRTLKRWLAADKNGASLAPGKRAKDMSIKPWYALALELRTRPQGSHVTWIAEQIAAQWQPEWGATPPSYDAVARVFREKISQIDQLKGRHTGSQLRSQRFYQHRTAAGLAPADEVHADGWNTHFTAPHPKTGEFVTHEIWHFHDVATRYVTPPGISQTENFEVIAKGLENFIRVFGIPLIVQTDSTKIVRGNDAFTKALHSFEERLGVTIVHPKEVGNSQANGICENWNISYLDKRSRELATCQNKSMDSLTFKRVGKITAKMVKAQKAGDLQAAETLRAEAQRAGKGRVFSSYAEAVEWINRIVEEYNDKPHRSLPKITCTQTGKKRHQTPREALNAHLANGWQPTLLGDKPEAHEIHLIAAFRRRKECKVTRETVSPYGGNRYANAEVLPHWNGKSVWVAYDQDDASQVWIFGNQGELICRAELVAATGYRAQTAYENAEEKRARAQIRHREIQIEQIRAQRMPDARVIEGQFERVKTIADFIDLEAVAVKPAPEKTIADFLPDTAPEKEATYADTMMWLYGEEAGKDGKDEGEVAAR